MCRPFIVALAATGLLPAVCSAQSVSAVRPVQPIIQRQVLPPAVRPATAWHSVAPGPRQIYGSIAAINANVLVIRLRNGRLQNVEVAAAIAHGDYSAPLFIGKPVSIDGDVRNGTFTAAHVFSLPNLNGLPTDR